MQPVTAVVAVTLNCNARCVMCDIWKNDMKGELEPHEYSVLPSSLRDINITGGEPFLRKDLPEIIAVIKKACPDARLVISSNGFTPARIEEKLKEILTIDPNIALRISIDGHGDKHEEIRGIRNGFEKDIKTLEMARRIGVKDLGIGMTIMGRNLDHIRPMYKLACDMKLEFSVTVASESEIYFGAGKDEHRPEDKQRMKDEFTWLTNQEYRSHQPKRWFRAWYERRLLEYMMDGTRPMTCDAGEGFFYLDSMGQVYACHLLPLHMGNIRRSSFQDIWTSDKAAATREKARGCEACFMICTSKSQIRKQLPKIAMKVMAEKAAAHFTRDPKAPVIAPAIAGNGLPIIEALDVMPLESAAIPQESRVTVGS